MASIPPSGFPRHLQFRGAAVAVEAPILRNRTTYVYAPCSPLDNAVRHVGISVDPKRRYSAHVSQAKSRYATTMLGAWINKLAANGLKPSLRILESVDDRDTESRENEWQDQYKDTLYSGGYAPIEGFSLYWRYSSEQEIARRDELARIELGCRVAEHLRTQLTHVKLRVTASHTWFWSPRRGVYRLENVIEKRNCRCCRKSIPSTEETS
jgi:hypothetical protein